MKNKIIETIKNGIPRTKKFFEKTAIAKIKLNIPIIIDRKKASDSAVAPSNKQIDKNIILKI